MTSKTLSLSASLLLAAAVACGGAQPNQPAPMPAAEPTAPAAPAAPATDPAAPATAPAATSARPTQRGPNLTPDGVVFNFKPDGKPAKIYLAGNFNSWNPSDAKFLLKNDGPSGMWSITVKLAPGTYQYKFVADGQWIKDPSAPGSAPDGFGGQNGTVDVK